MVLKPLQLVPPHPSPLYDLKRVELYKGPDSDGDGLPDEQEWAIGTDPFDPDTDGDALPDGWEVNGHNYVDYPSLGAKPRRKNIFVECDYLQGRKPLAEAIEDVKTAFARAPVGNPDDSMGIDLYVDIDDEVPLTGVEGVTNIELLGDQKGNPQNTAQMDFKKIKNKNASVIPGRQSASSF